MCETSLALEFPGHIATIPAFWVSRQIVGKTHTATSCLVIQKMAFKCSAGENSPCSRFYSNAAHKVDESARCLHARLDLF